MRAAVTPVEGDPHWLGARVIADFLAMDGWEVDFLWTGTPAKDLAEYVRQRNVDLVALSVTQAEFLPNARAAAAAIRERNGPAAKILLGGRALDGTDLDLSSLGCDAVAGDALQALTEARRLVGLTRDRISLEEQLTLMGQRIREARSQPEDDSASAGRGVRARPHVHQPGRAWQAEPHNWSGTEDCSRAGRANLGSPGTSFSVPRG